MTDFLIDGLAPAEDDLRYLALVNYGAYTSFRVEAGCVRGLNLHLARLRASSIELFGEAVDEARLRDGMRLALAGRTEAWLRVSLFSPDIWPRRPSDCVRPRVMTVVSTPPPPLAQSLRLQVQTYGRDAAHLKHTATFPLIHARRKAREAGFDDALFTDAEGLISEGSLWNIGFLRGDHVVWPQAPMLRGVAQALIEASLPAVGMSSETRPVRLGELAGFDGAFICNSATPACAVTTIATAIAGWGLDTDPARIARLVQAWAMAPAEVP